MKLTEKQKEKLRGLRSYYKFCLSEDSPDGSIFDLIILTSLRDDVIESCEHNGILDLIGRFDDPGPPGTLGETGIK